MFRLTTAGIWGNDTEDCIVCRKNHLKDTTYWYSFLKIGCHCSKKCLSITILKDSISIVAIILVILMICLTLSIQ